MGIKIKTHGFSNVGYLRRNNQQFFAQVHLSNDKQKMWYAKTRVAGRALEY